MKEKRISKPGLLRPATPYPWKRNYKGDLCGADGSPIYFRGSDAVLVEHAPEMAEALVMIHALTAVNVTHNALSIAFARWPLTSLRKWKKAVTNQTGAEALSVSNSRRRLAAQP